MTMQSLLPRLLTGRAISIGRMLDHVEEWEEKEIIYNFDKVPERYEEISNDVMSNFIGLQIFTEIINFFRGLPDNALYEELIKIAQKRALYYHSIQFKQEQI